MKFFTNQKSHYESLRASDDIDAAAVAMQLRKRGRRVRSTFVNLLLIEAVHLVLFVGWMGLTEQIHVFDDKLSSSCMYLLTDAPHGAAEISVNLTLSQTGVFMSILTGLCSMRRTSSLVIQTTYSGRVYFPVCIVCPKRAQRARTQ